MYSYATPGIGETPNGGIEARSIDWVPETERHGRIWHQAPLWFLGNFQYFSIPIGSSARRSASRWAGRFSRACSGS